MATYTNAVQQLYVAYFNRPADAAGLAYWEGVVTAANGNTAAVSAAFAASAEYKAEYDQLTLNGVVAQVYQNLFGHAPDTAGQAYWVKALNDKVFTIDQVVTQIAAGAQTTDKVAYDSKVLVATAFTNALDLPAEKTGYTGGDANTAAKEFLATITTAAQATAAIAPAALDASVAGVIKAGVPFTLTGALTALVAANEARAEFLEENDDATALSLAAAVTTANTNLDVEVDGDYAAATEGVQAALLADEIEERADQLIADQKTVTAASVEIAKVAALASAVATDAAADASVTAAGKVVTSSNASLQALKGSYDVTSASVLTIDADGTASSLKAGVTKELIELSSTNTLVLVAGVTETTNPGITAILAASIAKEAADKVATNAAIVAASTQVTLNRLDYAASAEDELIIVGNAIIASGDLPLNAKPTPVQITAEIAALAANKVAADAVYAAIVAPTLAETATRDAATNAVTAFNTKVNNFDLADTTNPLVDALIAAELLVKNDNTAIKTLNTLITKLNAATASVAELKALDAVIAAAEDNFTDHDFAAPVTLSAVSVGTSETDIFLVGSGDSQIFSMSGDDALFVGADYVLNTGKLTTGANGALEVFIAQVGGDTVVTIETETYGSASGDTIAITLTGVTATDVHFANGIITV